MRRVLYFLTGLAVLAALGWNVWRSQALIAAGEEVLLALAPVDPRSLMQGDYMRLRWDIERQSIAVPSGGAVVVLGLDQRRVGTFVRLAEGAAPGTGEKLFRVAAGASGGASIEPHSFLFQEGTADLFAKAKFGIFRVDASGRHLLVGLADESARPIEVPAASAPAR